ASNEEFLFDNVEIAYAVVDDPAAYQVTLPLSAEVQIRENNPDQNFMGEPRLYVREGTNGSERVLINFNIAAIPAAAKIESATLYYWVEQESSGAINLHRMLSP